MQTYIHTSKKLEKTIKPLIQKNPGIDESLLGKWNATLFYVNRKKCWMVTNAQTQYNVLLTDIKAAHLKNIEQIFKDTFYTQLVYDGIIIPFETVVTLIGNISFLPTDNDRSTTAFQNHRLEDMEYWKAKYGSLEHMPIKKLNHNMNTSPINFGKTMKRREYTTAIDEMKELLLE
jgi:hypothetical protein|tara:strand:- start:14037 stop:14561 length:525 start_codon:yes stop_codon:yes gene_type:complete